MLKSHSSQPLLMVSGVRHRTADILVREQFALPEEMLTQALQVLQSCVGIEECVIVSTCNRTELYAVVTSPTLGMKALAQFYQTLKHVDIEHYESSMFHLLGEDVVNHLFRVTSGLDSLIIGEGQIMGQVKEALQLAQQEKTCGILLDRLFKAALHAGKRVRSETGIADKDVSVSRAAYQFAQERDPQLLNRRLTLIGGGKMAEIVMSILKQGMTPEQQRNVVIVNRSETRLAELSERYGFQGLPWSRMKEAIDHAEVLFVATGAPHVVLGIRDFENKKHGLILDIAVPRNVDPRVGNLPGLELFNTDDLSSCGGVYAKETLIEAAEHLIEEEWLAFHQWWFSLPVLPTLTRLREKLEQIRLSELSLSVDSPHYELLDRISKKMVHKILHEPSHHLKRFKSAYQGSTHANALQVLFDLKDVSC